MRSLRLSYTERRRRTLALRVAEIERMEARSTVTPVGLAAFAVGSAPVVAQLAAAPATGQNRAMASLQAQSGTISTLPSPISGAGTESMAIVPQVGGAAGGTLPGVPQAAGSAARLGATGGDPMAFVRSLGAVADASSQAGLSASWKPARSLGSGAGALPPRGGSGGPAPNAAVHSAVSSTSPARNPGSSSGSAASSAALLSTLGLNGASSAATPATTVTRNALAAKLGGTSASASPQVLGGSPMTPGASPAFTLVTLDYNDGSPLVPGAYQLATPGGSVDLRAQVVDSASGTYTYSWNTSGLTDATGISGTGSYDLTFHWNTSIATAGTQTATLTVTDPSSNQVSQTYTFWAPATTGSTTGGTTWPASLDPGSISIASPSVASQNVSVVSATGAAETSIGLPGFNPNVSPVSLQYDSLSANALPIIDVEHPLDPTKGTPSTVTAQLTFNGTPGTTWYYNSSSLTPGDIMQIGLQANATTLSTGRYGYSAQVIDYRGGTPTTFTYAGTATLVNEAQDPTFSALGAGWTVSCLEKIIPASGGVILDEGGGAGLWFSGSFGTGGGTYTSPAGDFSTLVLNSNGTYTRTLTDGTVENFNSSGLETSVVDRNGLTTAFGYSGNLLQTITDPFSEVTTFTYSGGYLQSIQDTANRLATFTVSGGDLTSVQYPDTNSWSYGYDGSGRLTSVTEPSSTGEPTKITTITYDAAERVGTITRADSTTEEFSAAQEQGWTNSGTSGSPAAPTLLAQVGSTYTDPVADVTTTRPDWRGMGLTDQTVNALGGVTTADRDANGLATITVDPMNRITQDAYDTKGDVTKVTNPDGSTVAYGTYNSFAEPASMTDELNRTTYYTYDSHGNRTVVEDPMQSVTTYTYSSTQPGMLTAQTAPAPVGQSSYTLESYQYDSKDRQTTITDADSDVTVKVYNNAGQVTQTTDPSSNVVTYSYDAMNRVVAMTTAAGTSLAGVTSYTYDKAGNQLTATEPDGYTTTTTYDALDRQATVENADTAVMTDVYDNAGRLSVLIDPVGNHTTFLYDSLGRQTTQVSPSVNSSSGVTSTTQYDADGEVTQTTDADGRVITYAYDSRGDQTGESWLNGSGGAIYVATYTYDSARQMTGAADSNSLLTIAYDKDGRVGTIATSGPGTGQPTVTLTYGYDPSGDVTGIQDSLGGSGYAGQGLTTYSYDPALRLTTITQSFGGNSGPIVLDSYNADGLVTQTVREIASSGTRTSVNTTYTYDANNDVTGISDSKVSYSGVIRSQGPQEAGGSGSYDSSGRNLTQTYNSGTMTNTYTYDHAGQLIYSGDGFVATYSGLR